MKITVEYDLEVEGQCDAAVELLKHLGIAGTPAGDDFIILANSIEIKDNYQQFQAENALIKGLVQMALDELGVPSKDYPAPVTNAVGVLREALKEPQQVKDK